MFVNGEKVHTYEDPEGISLSPDGADFYFNRPTAKLPQELLGYQANSLYSQIAIWNGNLSEDDIRLIYSQGLDTDYIRANGGANLDYYWPIHSAFENDISNGELASAAGDAVCEIDENSEIVDID